MHRLAVAVALASLLATACQKGTESPPQKSKTIEVPAAPPGKNVGTAAPGTDPAGAKPHTAPKTKQVPAPFDVATPPADAEKTASGLVFKAIAEGTGAAPGRNDHVKLRYSAWRPDGTTFATTEGAPEPTSMYLFSSAPGFAEALMKMKVGGKAMFWVPPDIGYPGKPRGTPEQLAYAVELVEVIAAPATPPDVAKAPADATVAKDGVKWKKLKTAAGGPKPRGWDVVHLAYTGWDATGKIFDSSEVYGKPVQAPVDRLPPVFTEVIPQMAAGERVRMWFPATLLGPQRPGGPQGELCFEVSLNEVTQRAEPPKAPADVAAPPADALKTAKGVAYKVLTPGTGPKPQGTDRVRVHYSGWTTDGKLFDSSVPDGKPREFAVGGVIAGWTDALLEMPVGSTWRVWIPEELAYKGAPGRPQGMLVFDMELLEIAPPAPAKAKPPAHP